MSNNRITPFVKRMRTNGGTIYTFSSAVEDIGLNINERNNVVKISHFALLDIPPINFDSGDLDRNFFNIKAIDGAFEYEAPSASIKDGRVLIAESFQNYALNVESNFLNRTNYDPTLIKTVSERVFWKWLKETGAIRFDKDTSVGSKQYWGEELDADGSLGYNRVVKYIGQVSAGNVRTDTFGTYNETYVLVPTSHGQTDVYFEIVEDDNYKHGMEIGDLGEKILGRESYTLPHPDGLSYNAYYDFVDSSTTIVGGAYTLQYDNSTGVWSDGWWYTAEGVEPSSTDNAYLTDSSIYLSTGIYNVDLRYNGGSDDFAFRRSKVDCLSLVWSLDELKGIYGDPGLTYDSMAIQYAINDAFNFNAVLVYYTVYNSTEDEVLGRNLLGVLFIDAPSGNSQDIGFSGITIPSLEKIMSGPGGFGTSYSLRLNIKTDNMVDDTTATIVDQATSDQLYAEDWTAAFANLNTAVNLLTQNTGVIHNISEQYVEVQSTQTQILNDLQALQFQVNDIGRDITGTANTLALFADGDDPLVDSSVYMKFGNVGIKNNDPKYPLHVSGTTKVDEIIIENAVKDTSGNILLGYGSPLQIGASTYERDIDLYVGGSNPILHVDPSGILMDTDVSVSGNMTVEGSAYITGLLTVESIFSPTFDFDTTYIKDTSNGSTLIWINGFLEASVGSSVSADGSVGSVQFANNAGLLSSDHSRFRYDSSFGRLSIGKQTPNYTLDVSGNMNVDGSILINGSPISLVGGSSGQIQYNNSGAFDGVSGFTYTGGNLLSWTGGINFGTAQANEMILRGSHVTIANYGVGTPSDTSINLQFAPAFGDAEIAIGRSSSTRTLTIRSNNQISGGEGGRIFISGGTAISGAGGKAILTGGYSAGGFGGDVSILGGDSGGGSAGDVQIKGGNASGGGGSVYISGGSPTGRGKGGNVNINAGPGLLGSNGIINLGTSNTSGIYLSTSSIPTGTPTTDEVLFIDTGSGNQLKRGTASGGGVSWSGSTANGIGTYGSSSSIVAESTLTYDGTTRILTITPGNTSPTLGSARLGMANFAQGSAEEIDYLYSGAAILGNSSNLGEYWSGWVSKSYRGSDSHYTYAHIGVTDSGVLKFKYGNNISDSAAASSGTWKTVPVVSGTTSNGVMTFSSTAQITTEANLRFSGSNLSLYSGATENVRITNAGRGDFVNDVVAYSTSISDIRLKENIKPIEDSLSKILQLDGISYTRKKDGTTHLGFIAQDVEPIIPEVVKDRDLPLEGEEGIIYKTINYNEIIPHLVEAMKEQQKMIEDLKAEIEILKNK